MKIAYEPINPVATFVNRYGETEIIHRPKGRGLRVFKGEGTPQARLNRAIAQMLGENIRARRLSLGLSQRQLCEKAGMVNANPKQRIHEIEKGSRLQGMRLGTLYAISHALDCSPSDLLPDIKIAVERSGVSFRTFMTISE